MTSSPSDTKHPVTARQERRMPPGDDTAPEPVSPVDVSRDELKENMASFDTATKTAREARVGLQAAIQGALKAGLSWEEIGSFVRPVLSLQAAIPVHRAAGDTVVGDPWPDASTPTAPISAVSLSPDEAQLVDLLRIGLTNQAIAGRLYVSKRSLEVRLTALYSKLGVPNKHRLLAQLGATPPAG